MLKILNTPFIFVVPDEPIATVSTPVIEYEERLDNPFIINTSKAVYTPFKPRTRVCDKRTPSIPRTRQLVADTTRKPYLATSIERRLDYVTAIPQEAVNSTPVYSRTPFTIEERATMWKNIDNAYKAMEKTK